MLPAKKTAPSAPPAQEETSLLSPATIFHAYQQENKRFTNYTKHWHQQLASLHETEQLFVVS
ncbi:hypothetical protein KSF_109970 [Reticulibacter mediterranei]|uniref:Uncharacterized protein n=1 Tax=Reticulibacter mediterranei TaxID=2778369 RepID=A0A8J3IRX7_9CHLR|nr:hypothetical protein KSF_109970 [Reticulibacter mediterranei]